MDPKEFKEILEEAYTTTNEKGELSKLLTKIHDHYENLYAEKVTQEKLVSEEVEKSKSLTEINEKLRSVNMDLFLKVGTTKTGDDKSGIVIKEEENNPVNIMEVYE